ncbi:hypothetical protein SAMN04489743_2860 [Pseudarthrobacter equi]|uniref:Uncharacterized protein n=1 Tax=Pseudarthrobacter equi TaxID=728066 RepID=A0A1H2A9Y1_9MICC|nr:hypothetical protein [Pseudarthrobacter equi]SDT42582.1 hypothetical protein SAMN04489743_2860 [Pseudarthrobacter equi]
MNKSYTGEELLKLARSERWQDQVTAATRTNVTPEAIAALMITGIHHEVVLALISRAGVTADELAWLAEHTDSPHALGRIAGHPTASTGTLKVIRDRAAGEEWEGWAHLHRYVLIMLSKRGVTDGA